MTDELLISIIIPTYNNANTIQRAVYSCLKQTYSNVQVIVIDDGSTDNTQEILNEITDDRLTVVKNENKGVGISRNIGICLSKGDYICFVDSDDYLPVDAIINFTTQAYMSSPDIIISPYCILNGNKKTLCIQEIDTNLSVVDNFFLDRIVSSPWSKMYKTSIIKENNIKFPNLKIMQDGVFNLLFMDKANEIAITDKVSYIYDKTTEGVTSNITEEKFKAMLNSIDIQKREYESKGGNKYISQYREFVFINMSIIKRGLTFENKLGLDPLINPYIKPHDKFLYIVDMVFGRNFSNYIYKVLS